MTVDTNTEAQQHLNGQTCPLRINIIGAGIAGLTLGTILRKNKHEVHIYERSRFGTELGAAVHMAPNAHGLFKTLGIDLAATGANEVQFIREYTPSGHIEREIPASKINAIWQHPWMLAHRVRVHDALKKAALGSEGFGHPCVLHLATSVESVDPETATITLEDGTLVEGDVIVGADGVHSKARHGVPGGPAANLFGSGKNGFRFMVPREVALKDALTRELCNQDGVFSVVVGTDRRIVMYPTSNNTLLNFLCIHPENESQAGEDWNLSAKPEILVSVYADFAPKFTAMLGKAEPDSLKLWKLWDMQNLPAWNHAYLALIGDAAHPFLPHQGQGAAMAMEDAVALGTVLEEGLSKEEIPARLKLYNDIRYDRACRIQQYTRLAGLDVQDGKLDTVEYAKYNFGHDEFHHSAQKLREWKWKQQPEFAMRMPVAFGPDPSMLVPVTQPNPPPSFRSMTVHFSTSRTLIQNFFPPGTTSFTFNTPGTLASCSFVQTTYKNVEWLGGRSYNTLALYVHQVSFQNSQQQKVAGKYVPIIFEDLAHTVVRDREVYGLPAVYGQVNVERQPENYIITASLDDVEWARIALCELCVDSHQTSQTLNGNVQLDVEGGLNLLAWRSAPGCGDQAESYAIKINTTNQDRETKLSKTWKAKNASIQLSMGHTKPTSPITHIVERLCEIPVYKVMSAELVEGIGAPSFGGIQRLP